MNENYVPVPNPVTSDYYIACHYFPGWNVHPNGYSAMSYLREFPERTPLLGYYDEANPEVCDWEIKWAREHGINCFIYCWYRKFDNMGKPITKGDLVLAHQFDALFNSRYGNMMDFAIMWECDNAATVTDESDFLDNLLPFWVEEYFNRSNYLKIDNKPVVYVYERRLGLTKSLGGEKAVKEAFRKANERIKQYGFFGIIFQAEYRGDENQKIDSLISAGYDGVFSYCWASPVEKPTQEEVLEFQMSSMRKKADHAPKLCTMTCSVSWDTTPLRVNMPDYAVNNVAWKLTTDNWEKLLKETKELIESLPEDANGRHFLIMDNWNEWCEGHYIAPHREGGFEYLKAIRKVFTKCDNVPDYTLPSDIGLGPYDENIDFNAKKTWYTF